MQILSKYSNVVIQLVITMVLSRLLSPAEYGTVAVVTVFLSFFQVLSDVGISTAIVQYRDLTSGDYNALFFFTLLLGIILSLGFCALSTPISWIYNDSRLVSLCCASAPAVLFSTLNMVPDGVMLKRREFRSIGVRLVTASVTAGIIAIVLAVAGMGAFALVANTVVSSLVIFLWNWKSTRVSLLRNQHFVQPLRRIFRFSIYQGGFSTINYFARNLDNMLVGAAMGSAQLGYYDKAYKLMQYPISYLSGVFSSVLQPYLASYQDRRQAIYECWVGICRVLALAGCLVSAVFFCFSGEIVELLYGDQWLPAAPSLSALALSLAPQIVNSTSGAIFQSAGRTDSLFLSGLICTGVSIVAILVGVCTGSIAVLGLCVSAAYCIHFSLTVYLLVWRVLGVSPLEFLSNFAAPVAAAVLSVAASVLAGIFLSGVSDVLAMIVRSVALAGVYALVCALTGQREALSVFKRMRSMKGEEYE